ncbi:MAG: COX15/CtaA family protein [Actinomycetota bacterium]
MGSITPSTYTRVVAIAIFALALIVVTGAAVRLTDSGLGCEDWPACNDEQLIPELAFHPWIEFGNRLLSGAVALAVGAAVLTAYRRTPRRADLIRWAWGLVAGVAAQIVLGGITVRVDLHPAMVGMHFLLSMVLLWNAVLLWVRAVAGSAESTPAVDRLTLRLGQLSLGLGTAVLVAGTLVTGTGPNSGDPRAERLGFDLTEITRVHSVTVWCFAAVTLIVILRLRSQPATPANAVGPWLLGAIVAQGGIGYLQFALGVPPLIVAAHIVGAIVVWCMAVLFYLRLFDRPAPTPDPPVTTAEPFATMDS